MHLNARSIVNKKNELNIIADDINPHTIGITKSFGLTRYAMFRRSRIGTRRGELFYILKNLFRLMKGNSTLSTGLVYRSPNINEEDNIKIQNDVKEISKGECFSGSGGGTVDDKVGKTTRDARESSPQPGRRLRGGKMKGRR